MKTMFTIFILVMAQLTVFPIAITFAETTLVECPKVYANNPFNLMRIENGEGWQSSEATAYLMYCRAYINPQGYITCYYTPAAHGGSDVFTLKKSPPENTTCKETTIPCRFECMKTAEPPKIDRAFKPMKPILRGK